jgi:uncharacterized membrane protein YqjE
MEATAQSAAETPPPTSEGISTIGALRRTGETLLSILHNRVELLTVELKEEKHWAVATLMLAVVAAGLVFTSIVSILITVAVLVPEDIRKWVMLGICLAVIAGLLVCVFKLRAKLKRPAMLHDSLEQMKKDIACLKEN